MTTSRHIRIGPVTCGNDLPLTLIAGPCQLESLEHALMIAESMAEACRAAHAFSRAWLSLSPALGVHTA